MTVTNNNRANHTLSYASGSGTNALTFTLTITGGNNATSAGDILSIGANAMALNGGTILDNSGDRLATTQTVTSGVDTGATTFPTATLVNGSAEFATTAVLGAVTAKVVSVEVAGGRSGHAVNDVVTIANGFGTGTNATYKVGASDEGKSIKAVVAYTDNQGFNESVSTSSSSIPLVDNGDASFSIKGTSTQLRKAQCALK